MDALQFAIYSMLANSRNGSSLLNTLRTSEYVVGGFYFATLYLSDGSRAFRLITRMFLG